MFEGFLLEESIYVFQVKTINYKTVARSILPRQDYKHSQFLVLEMAEITFSDIASKRLKDKVSN